MNNVSKQNGLTGFLFFPFANETELHCYTMFKLLLQYSD